MEEKIENKIKFKNRIINFYSFNKVKIYIFLFTILIAVSFFFFIKNNTQKNNILISEKYVEAGLLLLSDQKDRSTMLYEEIILSKNNIYSILALNKIIEKSLLNDQTKILEYFNILEKSNFPDDQKDLITFKKALYLIKELKVQEGKKILQQLISKDSNLKTIAKELIEKN